MSSLSAVCQILLWCTVTRLPANMSIMTTSKNLLVWQLVKQDSLPKDSIFTIPSCAIFTCCLVRHIQTRYLVKSAQVRLDWLAMFLVLENKDSSCLSSNGTPSLNMIGLESRDVLCI